MDPPRRPPWSPLLLLALLLLLPSGRAQEASVETCCSRGYEWASQKKDCRFLSSDRDSKECRIAQEQCCLSQLEVLHCTTGMAIASKQENCDLPRENSTCEDKIIKKCCYCCFLGKEAQKQGHSCEQSLLMGYQCGLVFRACCVEGQENSDAGIVDGPNKELVEINLEDHYLNDRCRGGGPCTQQCRDTGTSVLCSCFMGYQLQPDGFTCEDINECITSANACNIGQICVNTLGSFRCQRETSCGTGYQLTEHNFCKDIDECETGIHNCLPDFICQNTPGSFRCRPKQQCKIGFIQDALGSCIDIDECALPTGGHICAYRCINVAGSFQCTCPPSGYKLAPNARNCQDIDECLTETHTCSHNQTCFNIQGGFRCLSLECPENYRKSGDTIRHEKTDTIRCIKSCRPSDANCILDPVHTISHTVISLPTFREFSRPEEIIFLRAITPAYATNEADIIFDITEGNLRDSFDIIKRYADGMTVGVVRQVKPIIGPFYATLKLEMNYVVGGVVSHRNVVNVHIFVSEYWF
ncbi:fibulin-1 isoform X3 [Notechis scutatus]|uniref:Fibulin-1 n=1 Tax=Notechis scutatus TaxID=8663 RepID=A0A6J1UVN3_9SAUR|nr:fibulin-1 isoform X3 [Notechis scutatus]